MASNEKGLYSPDATYVKGTKRIPDTCFKVLTVKNDKFVKLGEITVKGSYVAKMMDEHMSIKGYEPSDLARKLAYEKFKEELEDGDYIRPLIVVQVF